MSMNKVELGRGVLSWNSVERRTDRYGTIWLLPEGSSSLTSDQPASLVKYAREWDGEFGDIIAVVTASRESTHIGDLLRGIFPSRPEVGEIIVLGSGLLYFEPSLHGGHDVGLVPTDGRARDWLDVPALYRAHEQSVALYFHPRSVP
jgi:hypothetical protein